MNWESDYFCLLRLQSLARNLGSSGSWSWYSGNKARSIGTPRFDRLLAATLAQPHRFHNPISNTTFTQLTTKNLKILKRRTQHRCSLISRCYRPSVFSAITLIPSLSTARPLLILYLQSSVPGPSLWLIRIMPAASASNPSSLISETTGKVRHVVKVSGIVSTGLQSRKGNKYMLKAFRMGCNKDRAPGSNP